jgi:hypothetical protein
MYDGREAVVVAEEIVFGDAQLKVEHIEELAFDASDVAFAKDTGAECPVLVLESGVIAVL